jgi:hypothetical protein
MSPPVPTVCFTIVLVALWLDRRNNVLKRDHFFLNSAAVIHACFISTHSKKVAERCHANKSAGEKTRGDLEIIQVVP